MNAPQRISLSRRDASTLLASIDEPHPWLPEYDRAINTLRCALAPRPEKPERAPVAKKPSQATKWKAIKAEVRKRSGGVCELCRVRAACDPHHAFGGANRRSLESVRTVIDVCRRCHDDITAERPSRAHWQAAQIAHFEAHNYAEESRRMLAAMESRELRDAAEQAGKAASR